MKTIRTVLQDNHSGESAWEGEMVTLEIPDAIFEQMTRSPGAVMLSGSFVDDIWNNNALPLGSNAAACDAIIEVFVSTEPSTAELSEYPWKTLNARDDIQLNTETWEIEDQSGNSAAFFHCD